MHSGPGTEFPTPEMDRAERELDARIDDAFVVAREVDAALDEAEANTEEPEPPTDEQVDRFRKYVLGHARTAQWQVVIDRIDRGELTWRGVLEKQIFRQLDRDMKAAFASMAQLPPPSTDELRQSGVIPAGLSGGAPGEGQEASPEEVTDGASDYFHADQDEEEWLDDARSFFRSP